MRMLDSYSLGLWQCQSPVHSYHLNLSLISTTGLIGHSHMDTLLSTNSRFCNGNKFLVQIPSFGTKELQLINTIRIYRVGQISHLVSIEPDFGTNAFVLQDALLLKENRLDNQPIEDTCVVHARIEKDWLKYSNNGTNTAIYTSLDKILSSLNTSQVCANNKGPTFLTADIDTVKSKCPSCPVYNNTGLDYYIQSAAVDFHRALNADIFIGNIKSSFSGLIILSRSFKRTFTYSEINGESCIRSVFQPSYNCTNCSRVKIQNVMANIQNNCLENKE